MKLDELARVSPRRVGGNKINKDKSIYELFELLFNGMRESVDRKIRSIDNIVSRHHDRLTFYLGNVFVGYRRRHRVISSIVAWYHGGSNDRVILFYFLPFDLSYI